MGKFAFSDESMKLSCLLLYVKEFGGSKERCKTSNLNPIFKSGYQSISVCAAFSVNGRTPLIRIEGHLNQEKYKKNTTRTIDSIW